MAQAPVANAGLDHKRWKDVRVLVTGHTGFKGSWLTLWLQSLGALVSGLSIDVQPAPALWAQAGLDGTVDHHLVDIRDANGVYQVIEQVRPEVVFHLAAQAYVRRSFLLPLETYDVNVMGTANVMDAVRRAGCARSVVVVTSDKCYDNREQQRQRPFSEGDPMGGYDPYSSSKGCAELVTDAFRQSFFTGPGTANVASARAGNVIGGGDWGEDRLIPDIMRATLADKAVQVRSPSSVRPWQHVLNPVSGYLLLAQTLLDSDEHSSGWNFGPAVEDAKPVSFLIDCFAAGWPTEIEWRLDAGDHPHEAEFLSLDSAKAREQLGWRPQWSLDDGVAATVEWFVELSRGADMRAVTLQQISAYEQGSL
jgi:CDP-glucose 4,6-dehydratase